MMINSILAAIVLIQLIINSILFQKIRSYEEENKKYYKKLRREFDARLQEMKDNISLYEEIVDGMNELKEGA